MCEVSGPPSVSCSSWTLSLSKPAPRIGKNCHDGLPVALGHNQDEHEEASHRYQGRKCCSRHSIKDNVVLTLSAPQ